MLHYAEAAVLSKDVLLSMSISLHSYSRRQDQIQPHKAGASHTADVQTEREQAAVTI